MPDPDLSSALEDVRKAYRLLWAYQRRVYDIVEQVAAEFEDMVFYWWTPLHADRPCQSGTNPMLRRWAWDMLPMVQVSYLFLPSGVDRNICTPGQWMLEVQIDSDSEFENQKDRAEPNPDTFRVAAESTSELTIYAWYCTGEARRNWFHGVWKTMDWPEEDDEVRESSDPPFKLIGKTINLAAVPDLNTVRTFAVNFKNEASKALGVTLA